MPLVESERKRSRLFAILAGYSVLPALGLACFRLPAWAMFRSEFGYPNDGVTFISHVLQTLTIILFLIIERRVSYTEKQLVRVTGMSTVVTLVGSILFAVASHNMLGAYIGAALCGAVSAIPLFTWGYYFCTVHPCKSAFQLTLTFAIYGLATCMFASLPMAWTTALMFVAPPISFLCFWLSIGRENAHVSAEPPFARTSLSDLPWGIFAVLFLCTLSNIFAKFFVPTSGALYSSAARLYWPVIFTIIFLLFCMWIFVLKRNDPYRLWPVFTLLVFSGLLCYATLSSTQPVFANGFFRATQECVMLFCWIIATNLAYSHKLPAITTFGLMTLVFVKSPLIVSIVISLTTVSGPDDSTAIVVAAVTALVLVVATVVLSNMNAMHRLKATIRQPAHGGDSALAPTLAPTATADAIAAIQGDFALTQREAEIASCFVKGYTMPQTADSLCISLDTVRSHSKNLYRKLGIHKKQELIALIEHASEEAGG